MGEYAVDYLCAEVDRMFGFKPDPSEYTNAPKKPGVNHEYKNVHCKVCKKQVKERGLWQHMRDVHGVPQVVQAIEAAKQEAHCRGGAK